MRHSVLSVVGLIVLVGVFGITRPVVAQTSPGEVLEVGAEAPDFELPGATRYGELLEPVRLSDYRGKTVVLAFFFKARTPG